MIAVQCACGQKLKVHLEHAGKRAKCPKCGAKLHVPLADGLPDGNEPPPVDENFGGVAGLLDEALVAPLSSAPNLEASPLPVSHPRPARRSASIGRWWETIARHIASILVLGVLVVLTLGIALGGRSAYQRYLFSQALGGGDDREALKQVAANLNYAVQYANESGELDNAMRRRLQMLAKVLYLLPPETDLSPLLTLKADVLPYAAAFDVVKNRASLEWLIEKSCDSDEAVRKFAAEALRPTFPFGRLDDADFARLQQRTSTAEKQQKYKDLYSALHRPYEARLVGSYQLAFDAIWQADDGAREETAAISALPRLTIACRDYLWTISFYGAQWSGKIDELPKLVLACPNLSAENDFALLPHPQALARSQLNLTWREESLAVSMEPLPAYVPAASGRVSTMLSNPGASRIPQGATTRVVTTFAEGAKAAEHIEWTLPAQPGFAKFDIRLVRAGP